MKKINRNVFLLWNFISCIKTFCPYFNISIFKNVTQQISFIPVLLVNVMTVIEVWCPPCLHTGDREECAVCVCDKRMGITQVKGGNENKRGRDEGTVRVLGRKRLWPIKHHESKWASFEQNVNGTMQLTLCSSSLRFSFHPSVEKNCLKRKEASGPVLTLWVRLVITFCRIPLS